MYTYIYICTHYTQKHIIHTAHVDTFLHTWPCSVTMTTSDHTPLFYITDHSHVTRGVYKPSPALPCQPTLSRLGQYRARAMDACAWLLVGEQKCVCVCVCVCMLGGLAVVWLLEFYVLATSKACDIPFFLLFCFTTPLERFDFHMFSYWTSSIWSLRCIF